MKDRDVIPIAPPLPLLRQEEGRESDFTNVLDAHGHLLCMAIHKTRAEWIVETVNAIHANGGALPDVPEDKAGRLLQNSRASHEILDYAQIPTHDDDGNRLILPQRIQQLIQQNAALQARLLAQCESAEAIFERL